MPHAYALHQDVTAPCLCCRAPRVFHFTSASDQVVCAACVSHLGAAKAERRDAEHVEMWAELYSVEQNAHGDDVERLESTVAAADSEAARLAEQVAQLTAVAAGDFAAAEVGGVRDLIENDVVRRAERNTELANRRIDRLMAALWRIDAVHHPQIDHPELCSCGEPGGRCPESLALEPERRALREWERRNVALAAEGSRHGLPAEHPAVAQGSPRHWR
jgi:hypothetical protein